mgnify:CR=1 FL=1
MGWLDAPRRWALGLWCGGLLLSAAAGWWAHGAQQARIAERLQTATTEIAQRIDERFRQYEFGLRGARGAVVAAGGEAISRGPFEAYVATRDLAAEFPGARGFGFIRRIGRDALATFETAARLEGPSDFRVREIAPHDGDHFVIQYIEPQAPNAAAVGLDVASEPRRRAAGGRRRARGADGCRAHGGRRSGCGAVIAATTAGRQAQGQAPAPHRCHRAKAETPSAPWPWHSDNGRPISSWASPPSGQ